jgi:hypothetical protein
MLMLIVMAWWDRPFRGPRRPALPEPQAPILGLPSLAGFNPQPAPDHLRYNRVREKVTKFHVAISI